MTNDELRAAIRADFAAELAALTGTTPETLPTSVPKPIGAKFLKLKNARTFDVWAQHGRHGIAMVRTGHATEPLTRWLLEHKMREVRIAEAAA